MLEKACHAVEQAGRGGGVFPEVLVDVARQWDYIHQKVSAKDLTQASSPQGNYLQLQSVATAFMDDNFEFSP